jgi:hypothetical protein
LPHKAGCATHGFAEADLESRWYQLKSNVLRSTNLIPFHASHSQETCPGRKIENQETYADCNTNDKETSARRETESATALSFTAT